MCLITKQQNPKIANKDIVCYKYLDSNLKSPYTQFQYEFDKLYTTKIRKSNEWTCFGNLDENFLDENYPHWSERKYSILKCLGRGFHSSKTIKRLQMEGIDTKKIYKCIIPKGSEYYEDFTQLFISDKLIVKNPVSKIKVLN